MQRFRGNVLGILSMLIIQFLLGMGVNLSAAITRHHPGANAPDFFGGAVQSVVWAVSHGPILLVLHTILGLLVGINSVVILVTAFRLPSTSTRVLAGLGVLGIVAAGFNGVSFLNYNLNLNSFFMSVGFALAVVMYTQLVYMTPPAVSDAPWS